MNFINRLIRKVVFCAGLCVCGTSAATIAATEIPTAREAIFSIDFSKTDIQTSTPCTISHDAGTEFNPTCGKSWKLDRYDTEANEYSFLQFEVNIDKEENKPYALELLACARKDFPLLSKVGITVNEKPVAYQYQFYSGPNSHYFPDANGSPSHLRWEVIDIGNELQEGPNTIRIELEPETQSGISISKLHIRPLGSVE